MDPVTRSAAIYFILLIVFRLLGKRSMAELTSFDFILLLIVGEATQQALIGSDFSITSALLVIFTLVGIDYALALIKDRSPAVERAVDGVPLIVVAHGRILEKRIRNAGVDEEDVLEAARMSHGIERLEQIRYAIQERDGKISIIPEPK